MAVAWEDNYFIVQGWMAKRLKLKGLEKDLFAIIYGFSQDDDSNFHGSLEYLSQMTGYTRNRVCDALKHLTELHYIEKEVIEHNGSRRCHYRVNSEILETHDRPKDLDARPKDLDASFAEDRPKDLDVNIKDIKQVKKERNKEAVRQKPIHLVHTDSSTHTVQKYVDMYNDICKDNSRLTAVKVITDSRKKAVLKILNKFGDDSIVIAIDKISKSEFILNNATWKLSFDWLFKESNFVKVYEGNYDTLYDNKKTTKKKELSCNRAKSVDVDKRLKKETRKLLEERGEKVEY